MSEKSAAHAKRFEDAQFSTFYVGDMLFGIPVQKVQEVLKYQQMTPVPLASPVIEGLINLRGQIITAIDLRRRLGLDEREAERLPMNVVVRTSDGAISLLVDEIGDVLDVEERSFEATSETLTGECRELVSAVAKLPRELLLVLDVDKTISL